MRLLVGVNQKVKGDIVKYLVLTTIRDGASEEMECRSSMESLFFICTI